MKQEATFYSVFLSDDRYMMWSLSGLVKVPQVQILAYKLWTLHILSMCIVQKHAC